MIAMNSVAYIKPEFTVEICPRCFGECCVQYQDHRGLMVVRPCARCGGSGRVFEIPVALTERPEEKEVV